MTAQSKIGAAQLSSSPVSGRTDALTATPNDPAYAVGVIPTAEQRQQAARIFFAYQNRDRFSNDGKPDILLDAEFMSASRDGEAV